MPKVVIRGFVNGEYAEETPALYLDVTPELVESWVARIARVAELAYDEDVYCLTFWEGAGEFFDLYSLGDDIPEVEALHEKVVEEEAVVLEEGTYLHRLVEQRLENHRFDAEPGARMRTGTDMLEVTAREVRRCSTLKHATIRVETTCITVEMLKSFL